MPKFAFHRFCLSEFLPYAINELAQCPTDSNICAVLRSNSVIEFWHIDHDYIIRQISCPEIKKTRSISQIHNQIHNTLRFISTGLDGKITEYNLETCSIKSETDSGAGAIYSSSVSNLQSKILCGCEDGTARIFELQNDDFPEIYFKNSFVCSQSPVTSVCQSFDDTKIVCGGSDSSIQIYEVSSRVNTCRIVLEQIRRQQLLRSKAFLSGVVDPKTLIRSANVVVYSVKLLRNNTLISCSSNGLTQFQDAKNGTLTYSQASETSTHEENEEVGVNDMLSIAVNKDETNVFSVGVDSILNRFVLLSEGKQIRTTPFRPLSHEIRTICVLSANSDTTKLLAGGKNCQIALVQYSNDDLDADKVEKRKKRPAIVRRIHPFAFRPLISFAHSSTETNDQQDDYICIASSFAHPILKKKRNREYKKYKPIQRFRLYKLTYLKTGCKRLKNNLNPLFTTQECEGDDNMQLILDLGLGSGRSADKGNGNEDGAYAALDIIRLPIDETNETEKLLLLCSSRKQGRLFEMDMSIQDQGKDEDEDSEQDTTNISRRKALKRISNSLPPFYICKFFSHNTQIYFVIAKFNDDNNQTPLTLPIQIYRLSKKSHKPKIISNLILPSTYSITSSSFHVDCISISSDNRYLFVALSHDCGLPNGLHSALIFENSFQNSSDKKNLDFKFQCSVPMLLSVSNMIVASAFLSSKLLVMVYLGNEIAVYDVEKKSFSDQTNKYFQRLKSTQICSSTHDQILDIALNPTNPNVFIAYSSKQMTYIDLSKPPPSPSVQLQQVMSGSSVNDNKNSVEEDKQTFFDFDNSNFKRIPSRFSPLFTNFLSRTSETEEKQTSMLSIEYDWSSIVSKIPLFVNGYGLKGSQLKQRRNYKLGV